ncbi:MAG: sulfate adenylyltransferase subunit CysN [Bacteroidota bacterium]
MSNSNGNGYLDMELLRFTTAGSVDDGKSTLIGRLLYDSKSIFEDQYESIRKTSERRGEETVNLALLTDGLRAEREQGITIDVAYRYFATPKRKFIIADTPGHIQYTRNMVTGASTANLAIILIDARKGVIEQTKRHAYIASLLRIPHMVICINKMDLMDYKQEVFEDIKRQFQDFASKLDIQDIRFLPISALYGDNIVEKTQKMTWYQGPSLLHLLENIHIGSDLNLKDIRFPVQYVLRPNSKEYHDYRGYSGRIAGGVIKKGDAVKVFPSGYSSRIKTIEGCQGDMEEAFTPMSVSITLDDDIDISRGDMIVGEDTKVSVGQDVEMMVCWMNIQKLQVRKKYIIKHTTLDAKCMIKKVNYKVDVNTLDKIPGDEDVGMNDIARITVKTTQPIVYDKYAENRITGSVILVDEATNETLAAGMII